MKAFKVDFVLLICKGGHGLILGKTELNQTVFEINKINELNSELFVFRTELKC
jgi:hypothetical protein